MYQPRIHMDEGALYELAESPSRPRASCQPILVRQLKPTVPGGWQIRDHRWRAPLSGSQALAGLDSVPVLVRDVPDEAAAAMALIENMQREDLNPLEEAQGLQSA